MPYDLEQEIAHYLAKLNTSEDTTTDLTADPRTNAAAALKYGVEGRAWTFLPPLGPGADPMPKDTEWYAAQVACLHALGWDLVRIAPPAEATPREAIEVARRRLLAQLTQGPQS
jgi:hypothetical protein